MLQDLLRCMPLMDSVFSNSLLQAPIPLAILVILVSLFLCVTPLVTDPTPKYFIAVGSVILAAILYFLLIYKQLQPKWMSKFNVDLFLTCGTILLILDTVTYFIQVLLEVAAPEPALRDDLELCCNEKLPEKQS